MNKQLELRCRRIAPNRCRIWRTYSIGHLTHGWRHISIHSTKFFRRELSFCINTRFFLIRWMEETLCKKKRTNRIEEQEKYLRSCQPVRTLRETIAQTYMPLHAYQLQESHARLHQSGETLCKLVNRTVFVKEKLKELNSRKSKSFVIWKMNFKIVAWLQLKFSNIIYGLDQWSRFCQEYGRSKVV